MRGRLRSLLDATKDLQSAVDPAVFTAVEDASKQLSAERKTSREKLLEDLALQRIAYGDGPQPVSKRWCGRI